jgi:ubiquinone/menaquinone biosynthesis C-methylase UbiE
MAQPSSGCESREDVTVSKRIVNPFLGEEAAALYRRGRLDHHSQAIDAIRRMVGSRQIRTALDVGCGTGLSTAALASVADLTIGLDAAPAMAEIATAEAKVGCVVALGELTPFRRGSFDAITVASALHWVDQAEFFEECRRLLDRGGWLAIYDHFFVGLKDRSDFLEWVKDVYSARYPVPFRGEVFGPESQVPDGYSRLGDAYYEDDRSMTRPELVEYHLSQSNTLIAVGQRGETVAATRAWLDGELTSFVPGGTTVIARFVGTVSCLQTE